MKKIAIVLSLFYLLSSCAEEPILSTNTTPLVKEQPEESHSFFIENGIMNFESHEHFESYLESIENKLLSNELNSSSKRADLGILFPKDFLPLVNSYDLSSSNHNARLNNDNQVPDEEDYSAEFEEVINENLIPNKALHYILDINRRVKIEGEIYQVTEAGTFIYSETHTDEFEELYENFVERYLSFSTQSSPTTYQYGNILFKDSYGYVSRKDLTEDKVIDFISGNYETFNEDVSEQLPSSNARTYDEYSSIYGLRTVNTNFTNKLGFFNVRTASFDSNHRVAVSLDQFNIKVVKYTNFKTKFQAKKTVKTCIKIFRKRRCKTLFTYWVDRKASDMVIGIDELNAELTFPFTLAGSQYVNVHNQFSKQAGNIVGTLTYQGVFKSDLLKNWSDEISSFGAHIQVPFGSTPLSEAAWNKGLKLLKKEISKRSERYILQNIQNDKEKPVMMVTPYLSKEHYYFNGVQEYKNAKEKKLTFPASKFVGFAAKFTNHDGSGYDASVQSPQSNKFKLTGGSIFGAVLYNGQWKGVRVRM